MTTQITRMACGWEMGVVPGGTSGSTGEWGNSSSLSVVEQVSTAARSGLYGLRLHPTAGAATQTRDFNLTQAFLGRFYMRYPTLPGANAHIYYHGAGGGAEINGIQVRYRSSDSALIAVRLDGAGAVVSTSVGPVISAGVWYRIDFLYRTASTWDWRVDGTAYTQLAMDTALTSFNRSIFGSVASQTFDLYIDDMYGAYSTDTGGENGAALAAEYPRGAGSVKHLVATATSFTDAAKFSMDDASDKTLAHTAMDNDPMIGAPGLRQDTASTTDYAEFTIGDLSSDDTPHAISVIAEGRTSGFSNAFANLKITKDGTEQDIGSLNWFASPQCLSIIYLPATSQTIKWTRAQVNGAAVRWGYAASTTVAPIIGGFQVMVDVDTVPGPGSPPTSDAPAQALAGRIGSFIDGRPVEFLDWQCSVEADWGERTLTGKIPRETTWAEQGASCELWRADGTRLWSGELTQDPTLREGLLDIRANGYAEHLAAARTRLFYRIDGGGAWVEAGQDPHTGIGNAAVYDLFEGKGRLRISWTEALVVNNTASFLLWMEGATVTRYSVLVDPAGSYSGVDFITRSFTGPNGTRTNIQTHSLAIGSPTTYASNISDAEDALQFAVVANGSVGAGRRSVRFTSIKAYGRTSDDAFSASEVVTDVGTESGFLTTNVKANPLPVLPLDWTEDHPSLLDYMAELTGWRWMMRGDGLAFGPYEREWNVSTAYGANAELEAERRYNRVVVPYRALSGALRNSTPAVPTVDPYPGREFTWFSEELEDPQTDSALANAVAAATVEHLASARISGSITVAAARLEGIARDPLEIEAGDLVTVTDLAPDVPSQRIREVTYAKGRPPVLAVGEAPFDPVQVIKEFQRETAGKRRRRQRRNVPRPP